MESLAFLPLDPYAVFVSVPFLFLYLSLDHSYDVVKKAFINYLYIYFPPHARGEKTAPAREQMHTPLVL